jgi:hypothetical protein
MRSVILPVWLGAILALGGCYPAYRPPAVGVPYAELDVLHVPQPLLCIDGQYFFPGRSGDVLKAIHVPVGRPIGVRARLDGTGYVGGYSCFPGVAFTPRAGGAYVAEYKYYRDTKMCSLTVVDRHAPPIASGPLVVYSSLTDLDNMKCEAD